MFSFNPGGSLVVVFLFATSLTATPLAIDGLRVNFFDQESGLCWGTMTTPNVTTKEVKLGIFSIRGSQRLELSPPNLRISIDTYSVADAPDFAEIGQLLVGQKCHSTWQFDDNATFLCSFEAERLRRMTIGTNGDCALIFSRVILQLPDGTTRTFDKIRVSLSPNSGILAVSDSAGLPILTQIFNQKTE